MVARARSCRSCEALGAELSAAQSQLGAKDVEVLQLRAQLAEALSLVELQRADLTRYKAEYERVRPNTPERVPQSQLQLAFAEVLASMSDVPAAKELEAAANQDAEAAPANKPARASSTTRRHPHGRRQLALESLPVEDVVIDPDEVAAAGGEGFELVGEEVSDRVAFKPSSYVRLHIVRRTWVRTQATSDAAPVITAPLPDSVWPSVMADPSAIAANIVAKYDDSLPLHRQERISARSGFRVPRSTQCNWLGAAFAVLYRIVDAMFAEAKRRAFCIATDATSAPVRAEGGCEPWHIFVFIADRDHVVFRHTREHTSDAVKGMLGDFRGHILSDAAPVYDVLHRGGAIEVACWFHLRRYFWRALDYDQHRALEALAIIAKLFEVDRECRALPLPEYTARRAEWSRPVLAVFDEWVGRHRDTVEPRSPLDQAIGYYDNQRAALHRFLADGRLRLDNSISEQQLRNAVLGRHNWMYFANEAGLSWYATFRSLIASCRLHGINAHQYLEQVLRLAPHWRTSRLLELSPKYWTRTLETLDGEQRQILVPPWQRSWPHVELVKSQSIPQLRLA